MNYWLNKLYTGGYCNARGRALFGVVVGIQWTAIFPHKIESKSLLSVGSRQHYRKRFTRCAHMVKRVIGWRRQLEYSRAVLAQWLTSSHAYLAVANENWMKRKRIWYCLRLWEFDITNQSLCVTNQPYFVRLLAAGASITTIKCIKKR